MERTFKDWLVWYLRQPFRLIVWFMETYAKNRERLKELLKNERAANAVKIVVVATFFVWLAVFAFLATDEQGNRFSCAVKSLMPGADVAEGCDAQPWQN